MAARIPSVGGVSQKTQSIQYSQSQKQLSQNQMADSRKRSTIITNNSNKVTPMLFTKRR